MRIRTLAPFALVLAVACGGAETDEAAMAEETQEYAAGADATAETVAAVEAVAEYWETHYNMGHASMVVGTMSDEALFWGGDGTTLFGKEAIEAMMTAEMEMASPQMDLNVDETILAGDFAVMRGTYAVDVTMEGETMSNSGYWVSLQENMDGEWKTHGIVGNMDAEQMVPPGESMSMDWPDSGQGDEIVRERLDYYMTHFNAGHASMVAETYTEDAVVMASNEAATSGRAAAEARIQEMIDAGMQITAIEVFRARELDDMHATAAGRYTIEGPDGAVTGNFAALYKRADDGALMLHRLLTANHAPTM